MQSSRFAVGAFAALALATALATSAWAQSASVQQALTLIRGACVLQGASLQIQASPTGWLVLRITMPDGRRASTSLAHRDLDAFSDAMMSQQGSQPFQVTACMEPYLSQVMGGLTGLPEQPTGPAEAPATTTRPAAAPTYQPPVLPSAAPMPVLPAAPPRAPALPGGDLPVGVILGTSPLPAAAAAVSSTPAAPADGQIAFRISGCRAAGNDVYCDVKVSNTSGRDVRVVVQGGFSKLYGADGSAIDATWTVMGNLRDDMRYGKREAVLKVIADTSPVLSVFFPRVPDTLGSIKRLELSMGAQTDSGTALQKLTLADVPIQGR